MTGQYTTLLVSSPYQKIAGEINSYRVISFAMMAKVQRPSDVKTEHLLRMDDDLARDLYAFCAAQIGSKKNPIICRAIREFINTELEGNALLNQRFQEAKAQLVASPVTEMRLVTPKSAGTG